MITDYSWIIDDIKSLVVYIHEHDETDDIAEMINGYGEYAISSFIRDTDTDSIQTMSADALNTAYKNCVKKLLVLQSLQTATDLTSQIKFLKYIKVLKKLTPIGLISGIALDWVMNNIEKCTKLILLRNQVKLACTVSIRYTGHVRIERLLPIVERSLCNTRDSDKFANVVSIISDNVSKLPLKDKHNRYINNVTRLVSSYNNINDISRSTKVLYSNAKNEYATEYYVNKILAEFSVDQAPNISEKLKQLATDRLTGDIRASVMFVATLIKELGNDSGISTAESNALCKFLILSNALNPTVDNTLHPEIAEILSELSGETDSPFSDELFLEYSIPDINLSDMSDDIKKHTTDTFTSISEVTSSATNKIKEGSSKAISSLTGLFKRKQPEEPVPLENSSAPLDKIRYLGELLQEGLITEDEFQTQKTKLLNQI